MPFVGDVEGRPSILKGEIDEIIGEAQQCLEKNVYGFDLLGYRYTGNQLELIRKFVSQVDAPVCIAGNINSFDKLNQLINIEPWAFTIGGAFFDNKFEGSFEEQINKVCMYLNQESGVK
jgi:putative N-acetylmannosamine-6-phosphate epimerase